MTEPLSPLVGHTAGLIEALTKALEALQRLHTDVEALMADSGGVYGLHNNGDPAPWDELREGGQFEDWIGTPLWSARNAWHDGQAALAKARTAAETVAVGTGGEAERAPNIPPQPSPGESQNTGGET